METNTDKITLGSLVNRITSPTPEFWVKVRLWWASLGGLATTVVAVDHYIAGLLPHVLVTVAKVIGLPAVVSWAHTFLAKKPDLTTNSNGTNDNPTA